MAIDWHSKLRHFLQVVAFCVVVAAIHFAFSPERAFGPAAVYSIFIGTIIWAVIDLGRHLFPSAAETGWPPGLTGLGLSVAGIVTGYVIGTALGDRACRALGWSHGAAPDGWRTSILITLLAGTAGSLYFYARNRGAYLERKMHEARQHASEARLKLLETQLEPHMLFNTLANLRALIAVDPARAQQMLDHMIAYLRATLNASRATTHPLQAEFERLRDYLELMAIRMGPRLSYTLQMPPELAQQPVPTLLLQPLVENCIQHGLEPKVEGGRITVTARRDDGALVLEVIDTGVGPSQPMTDRTGFGLQQVRERLATLHEDSAELQFGANPEGGSRAVIRLPLRT